MRKLKTVELFAGTASFSKVMAQHGHETFTVDNNSKFNSDLTIDLLHDDLSVLSSNLFNNLADADILWMSPPCTSFSLASGNIHWTADREPKTQTARDGYALLKLCEAFAEDFEKRGKIFFIENPNGRAVWFLPNKWLKRVWYCQYGDTRAKPTNIWTNLDIDFKTCKSFRKGQPRHCHHESAPRESEVNQGLKGNMERSVIPPRLFESILDRIIKLGVVDE